MPPSRKYPWMDEGFNTFTNSLAEKSFNNGEYAGSRALNPRTLTKVFFTDSSEAIMTTPDVTQLYNLGAIAYRKPGLGLQLLRENVLGKERFDSAFKYYVHKWAFKHPTPWDFFHCMENAAGESLDWFWRSWFLNNWKLDQSVQDVAYEKNDPSKGSIITIVNLEKMPMPVTIEIKEANGKTGRITLPVEVWQHGNTWKFIYNSTDKIEKVTLDPDNTLPDVNVANNSWGQKSGF